MASVDSQPRPSAPRAQDASATLTGGIAPAETGGALGDRERRRRIAYFMLFRLGMLSVFTALAAAFTYTGGQGSAMATGFVWATLVVGFALTIVFARQLPRVRDLHRFAWMQTATDIVLAAVVVEMSGGADSGFQWLYLIAVLGAATMGGQRMVWAAAGACVLILATLGALQGLGVVEPTMLGEPVERLPPREVWAAVGRTAAAVLGVSFLSSYLQRQLSTTVTQVGELRVLNENIVRSLNSGLLTLDNDGVLLYYNPAAEAMLKIDPARLGRDVEDVLPGLRTTLADRSGDRFELSVDGPAGPMHLGLSRVPLRDAAGERVGELINFTDLTPLRELTEQVRRNERLAALGGLAASVAHEIRNPLTAIGGSAELLGSTADLDEQDRRLVKVIQREANRLTDLIADLLAFTRPKSPQPVRLSLAGAIRDTREAFTADPMNRGVEVAIRVEDDVVVHADPAQLSQVIWNLVRNAAEAMDRKGRVSVVIRRDGEHGRIDFIDDGPGISAEHVERIFDPFFTTKAHGTGFGLAIVHRVVEENGGTIDVASEPGHGATFTIRLPLADAAPAGASPRTSPLRT